MYRSGKNTSKYLILVVIISDDNMFYKLTSYVEVNLIKSLLSIDFRPMPTLFKCFGVLTPPATFVSESYIKTKINLNLRPLKPS